MQVRRNREMKRKIVPAVRPNDDSGRGMRNREMKREIDPPVVPAVVPTADDSDEDRVPDRLLGTRGYDIYVDKMEEPDCFRMGDDPPKVHSYFVAVGTNFLKKTIRITPDSSVATLCWNCDDEMSILVKGKDSVCAVAHDKVEDRTLQASIYGTAAPFIFEEKAKELGCAPCSSKDDKKMPFAKVILSLDTTKEDCGDSPSLHYLKDSCDQDFGARYDKQIAISFLKNRMKQVPVIGHEETVQTAIKAFKILLREDFKGDEMKVYFVRKDFLIGRALSAEEIREHLAAISD